MIPKLEKYCPKCGFKINPQEDRFCLGCGEPIILPEEEPVLSDEDVKDIPIVEKSPIEVLKEKKAQPKIKDFWLSGSYYLVVIANGLTLILVAAKIVNPVFIPFVIIITLFGISLLGAFQMRFDQAHKGINFLKLIFLSFKKFLSFLSEADKPKKPDKPTRK
ncbi:MAG: zinc ribbon domain-containing protein [candidate division WOR-3 bacterium]|nr:zinc ribbon domain-containing protein [candidate division WOR-3 bacterium]